MVFDIERVSEALDNVTLEIVTGVIWNSERLKRVIEILLEVKEYRNCIKEIDDLPLEVVLSQNMYKLNGEIKRLSELRITKILNLLGNTISEDNLTDEILNKIDLNLNRMNNEWDQISDDFRYKNNNSILVEIVEGFMHLSQKRISIKNQNNPFSKKISEKNIIESSSLKTDESVEPETVSDGILKQNFSKENEDFTKEIISRKRISNSSTGRTNESNTEIRNDALTFGGVSNRFVKISSSINLEIYSDKKSADSKDRLLSPQEDQKNGIRKTEKNYNSMKNFGKIGLEESEDNDEEEGKISVEFPEEISEISQLNQISKQTQKKVNEIVAEERKTSDSQQTIPTGNQLLREQNHTKSMYITEENFNKGSIFKENDIYFKTDVKQEKKLKKGPIRIEGRYTKYNSFTNFKENRKPEEDNQPLLSHQNLQIKNQFNSLNQAGYSPITYKKNSSIGELSDSKVRSYALTTNFKKTPNESNKRQRSKTPVRIIKNKKSGKYEIITKSPLPAQKDQRIVLNSNKELRKRRETLKSEIEDSRKNLFKTNSKIKIQAKKNKKRKKKKKKKNFWDIVEVKKYSLEGAGLNDVSFVDCFNFYGATIEGDIYAYQIEGGRTYKQLEVETLDLIKDLLIDTDHHIVFTQLQSGVFLAGVNGNKFICAASQSLDASRAVTYVSNFGEILVVTDNRRIESFSQFQEYTRSGYLDFELKPGNGIVRHVIPGKIDKSKVFVLTDTGVVVHIGNSNITAQVNITQRDDEIFHSMALSSDQSLLAVAGTVSGVKPGMGILNFIYVFQVKITQSNFSMVLLDSIDLKSCNNDNKKEFDFISSIHFIEKENSIYLTTITKKSAILNIFEVAQSKILEICDPEDFSEEHEAGNCKLFKREILGNECDFYLVSARGLIHRIEFNL